MKKLLIVSSLLLSGVSILSLTGCSQNTSNQAPVNVSATQTLSSPQITNTMQPKDFEDNLKKEDKINNESLLTKSDPLTKEESIKLLLKLKGSWIEKNRFQAITQRNIDSKEDFPMGAWTISFDDGGTKEYFDFGKSFFDSGWGGKISKVKNIGMNKYSLVAESNGESDEVILQIKDNMQELEYSTINPEGQPEKISYVKIDSDNKVYDSLPKYFSQKVLTGVYVDSNGKSYEFKTGEQALWPGRTFKYSVSQYHAGGYFNIQTDNGEKYIIEMISGKLRFFTSKVPSEGGDALPKLVKVNLMFELSKK